MANESQTVSSLLEALGDDTFSAVELSARLPCNRPTLSRWVRAAGGAHVIVKFSPSGSGAIAERWRDLLRGKHHALETLTACGMAAARW